ncbi:MAG: hypothetical protein JWN90_409 [Parcubacteria group bacterium]|nr:hypothetical protein [Parcubacteria group bacterium]
MGTRSNLQISFTSRNKRRTVANTGRALLKCPPSFLYPCGSCYLPTKLYCSGVAWRGEGLMATAIVTGSGISGPVGEGATPADVLYDGKRLSEMLPAPYGEHLHNAAVQRHMTEGQVLDHMFGRFDEWSHLQDMIHDQVGPCEAEARMIATPPSSMHH